MVTSAVDLLLITLVNANQPLRIRELKKSVGTGLEKKELNKLLYGLQERGLVERTIENPPLWSATVAAATVVVLENSNTNNDDDQGVTITQEEQKLISNLIEQGKEHGMSAGSLAAILGKSIAATNRMLYGLEKNTKSIERSLSNPPLWKIIRTNNDGELIPRRGSSSESSSTSSSDTDSNSTSSEKSSTSSLQDSTERGAASCIGELRARKRLISSGHPDETSGRRSRKTSVLKSNINITEKSLPHKITVATETLIKEVLSKLHDPNRLRDGHESSWAKKCSDAVWQKYRTLNRNANDNDIVAGFIVQEDSPSTKMSASARVVALGSGTKCIGGDQLSCDGMVVQDSHAEVVARRSLVRWLYYQIQRAGQNDSLAVRNTQKSGKPFRLKPFKLFFYTSQTPCGDSAVYSYGKKEKYAALCWQGKNSGCFRIKLERGQGTTFAPENMLQSMDGLKLGDRVMHNSCSDKMAKWSVLGVQGALLSRLIQPIYIDAVIVGDVFSHGHVCRALCCRSDYALKVSNVTLPKPFKSKHPRIRHAPLNIARCVKISKRSNDSCNWAEQDSTDMEVVDGTTGQLEQGKESRICKKNMFRNFTTINSQASFKLYSENKALAIAYQTSKKLWKESMRSAFGHWMDKPDEVDEFSVRKVLKQVHFDI